MTPKISVITVTYRRRALLLRKLASLERQTLDFASFEWIVVANGDDESADALRRSETSFRLVVLESEHGVPVGVARNRAAAAAASPLLHFSDDDCLLGPGVLEAHLAAQQVPGVVIGAIEFEAAGSSDRFAPRKVGFWHLNGANTTVPTAVFQAVGGFDASLDGYGGEDLLLGYHLVQAGVTFRSRPDIVVRHIGANPLWGRDSHKAESAGRNAVRIARRHPELATRLGVHALQLAVKRLLWLVPLWGRLGYERAYLRGAIRERRAESRAVASNGSRRQDPPHER